MPVVEEQKSDEYSLTIELPDGEVRAYTLGELRARFKTHRVTAVLQCSGNRRRRHDAQRRRDQWPAVGVGAISNAEWEGVRLADVLADAGVPAAPEADDDDAAEMHVQFSGLEAYGSSIPLHVALDPRADVLLAFGMNGRPLPRDHGYPLRAVVPRPRGRAVSQVWLSKIVRGRRREPVAVAAPRLQVLRP